MSSSPVIDVLQARLDEIFAEQGMTGTKTWTGQQTNNSGDHEAPSIETKPNKAKVKMIDQRPSTDHEKPFPCSTEDPELWFSEDADGIAAAKKLCARCPAIDECLAGALARNEIWGVWGGQLLINGRISKRKARTGRRPTKNENIENTAGDVHDDTETAA